MRRRAWLISAIGASVTLFAIVVIPWPADDLASVAARFAPDGGTAAGEPSVEPRRVICLGADPCPSVSQRWTFEQPFSSAELQSWLDSAGYEATVEGDCSSGTCVARGSADGWSVLAVSSQTTSGEGPVSLGLWWQD